MWAEGTIAVKDNLWQQEVVVRGPILTGLEKTASGSFGRTNTITDREIKDRTVE